MSLELVSSDTNIWIDFEVISRLNLPFLLPYQYIMYHEAAERELLNPPDLKENLIHYGLSLVRMTIQEASYLLELTRKYRALSNFDAAALAIAKKRSIPLFTGDKALRNAAQKENVDVIGSIGILDQLFEGKYIAEEEYIYCLAEMSKYNGNKIRLPQSEIDKRMNKIKSS